jgi:hypothetical protein
MRPIRHVVCLAALSAVLPAAAHAGGGGFVITDVSGGTQTESLVQSDIKLTGAITVDFHGDAAAGCAAAHLCDVTGTVKWNPAGAGSLFAFGFRDQGRRFEQGYLTIGDLAADERPMRTSARVRREGAAGSLCADAAPGDSTSGNDGATRGSSLKIRLIDLPSRTNASGEVLRTDCAGPMARDVAALLPSRRVGERALVRGHRTLDFSADRTFAAHGLAGTLHSTVRLELVGGHKYPVGSFNGRAPRTPTRRKRAIEVAYRVQRVTGGIATDVRGRGDRDLCGPFDACGVNGSVTTTLSASSGSAFLTAEGSIRRTRRDLRRAVGLARGRAPRTVARDGYIAWGFDRGSVVSELERDGAPACTDSTPIVGGGAVYLQFTGGRVRAGYGSGGGLVAGFDVLQTRCPGPSSLAAPSTLATGTFPLRAFGRKRVVLRLTEGRGFSSGGYGARSRPDVTVVLRRTRIDEYTYREPIDPDPYGNHVRSLR